MVWNGGVYGWKDELRDLASERPGAYAVDKAGLIFKAEGGDDYNGAEAWVAVVPLASQACVRINGSEVWWQSEFLNLRCETGLGISKVSMRWSPNRLRLSCSWPSLFRN